MAALDTAIVSIWGADIGAISWIPQRQLAVFEYMPEFVASTIQLSPFTMPLSSQPFSFAHLAKPTFNGLPGMLADALPDRFGQAVWNKYLQLQGQDGSANAVDQLCFLGNRAMGALQFAPSTPTSLALAPPENDGEKHILDVAAMVELARQFFRKQTVAGDSIATEAELDKRVFTDLVKVGIVAGGARAKAVVVLNEASGEIRLAEAELPSGFQHWLIKFDGVCNDPTDDSSEDVDYGLMEYAYFRMARDAGIEMSDCRLLQENSRNHFLTRRFDRTSDGEKLHMQSLCGLAHYDFNQPGAYSYEQAMEVVQKLDLGMAALEQLFRRALFNVLARNHDDHAKHIAFLMDSSGEWRLAPAFDLTFAFNPDGKFTRHHQLSLNGKLGGFVLQDFRDLAGKVDISQARATAMIEEVSESVGLWPSYAAEVGVSMAQIERYALQHRLLS